MTEIKLSPDPIADQLRQQYPSNSKVSKPTQPEKEKVKPVVSGKTSLQKESLGQKIRKMFIPSDIKDIRTYAIEQILIPGAKDLVLSIIELTFYGRTSRRVGSGIVQRNQTNYSYISSSSQPLSRVTISRSDRATHNFRNVVYSSYEETENVISTLLDLVDRYGQATVADYYDASNIESDWASADWGWRSFNKLESRRIADGYVIDMPQPIYLK